MCLLENLQMSQPRTKKEKEKPSSEILNRRNLLKILQNLGGSHESFKKLINQLPHQARSKRLIKTFPLKRKERIRQVNHKERDLKIKILFYHRLWWHRKNEYES